MTALGELNAFSSATAMAQALRRRRISAVELLQLHVERIERLDPALNSVVVKVFDRATQEAKKADERIAAGDTAPLLGVPVTVKESIDMEGLATTAGVPERINLRAKSDAPTVRQLRQAGAVILGKTNVCTWLQDFQADNPIYGRSNNPWDLSRTSGGSSGGSATLAAGLTALDLGSDLGGSIRVPPAFCGLWGHKPSVGIVQNTGHFPGSDWPSPALPLAVQGPQARSAADLELMMETIAGPDALTRVGWQLHLPPARHAKLKDFRIAVLPSQAWLTVDPEILAALDRVANHLRGLGVSVVDHQPTELGELREYYRLFRSMMWTTVSVGWPAALREKIVSDKLARGEEFHAADTHGILATAPDQSRWLERREIYRAAWNTFFKDYDLLLAPITLTSAFEHTTVPNADRRLKIAGRDVEFEYMSFYPALATLAGQPATVFPAGQNSAGLPLGLQVIGPMFEDRTTIAFCRMLEEELGSFKAPPGYS